MCACSCRRTIFSIFSVARSGACGKLAPGAGKHIEIDDRLEFVAAELTRDEGWGEAPKDCTYVSHISSPIQQAVPKKKMN